MKRNALIYRVVCTVMVLLVCASTLTGAEYRGDQYRSPILRFLYNLFLGGSSHSSRAGTESRRQTYRVGESRTGATISAEDASSFTAGGIGTATSGSAFTPVYSTGYSSVATPVTTDALTAISSGDNASSGSPISSYTAAASSGVSSSVSSSSLSSVSVTSLAVNLTRSSRSSSVTLAASADAASTASTAQTTSSTTTTTVSGFRPPPNQPMPVGNGVWTLLSLSLCYLFLIRKRIFRAMKQ